MNGESKEEPSSRSSSWSIRLRRLAGVLRLRPRNLQGLTTMLQHASDDEVLDRDLLTMIEGVLSVGDMRVRDIMIPRSQMKVLSEDATAEQILTMVTDGSHSRFPVVGDNPDQVEGILHAKDLLRFFSRGEDDGDGSGALDVSEYLRPAVIVPESKRLKVLLEEFRKNRNHMAIVVDEYGGVSGLVTIEDVLEQIVGDITDEYDVEGDSYVFPHAGGGCRVKALMPMEDFNRHFETDLSNGSAGTIGGLVVNALGRMPRRGEVVEIDSFRFEIVRADNRRVHSLLVRKKAG